MTVFPHSRLFLGPARTIAISGPHIQVLDTETGAIVHSTAQLRGPELESVLKSGSIRCAAVDGTSGHVVTTGEDKKIKVWAVDDLTVLNEREAPKKPTEIQLTADGQTIVVSDKFGDVFSYPLHLPSAAAPAQADRGPFSSHENPAGGHLVLGHTSMLTAFLLTADERHIVTADRDEHVRVSWFPQGYNIEAFCLGHRRFVSAVHIPPFAPGVLVSGGGDPALKVWDWAAGRQLREIEVADAVRPFLRVPAPRTRAEDGAGADGAGDGAQKKVRGRKGRKWKSQEKKRGASEVGEEAGAEAETAQEKMEVEAEPPVPASSLQPDESAPPAETASEEFVFALHKITSHENAAGYRTLLFSAVGATALFACAFPDPADPSSPAPALAVHSFDFAKPVLDFVVGPDGLIWVLLDGAWGAPAEPSAPTPAQLVRVVAWDGVGARFTEPPPTPLVAALNSTCLIPASPAALTSLDLYAALAFLPKRTGPGMGEGDAGEDEDGAGADGADEPTLSGLTPASPRPASPAAGSAEGKGKGKAKATKSADGPPTATPRALARLKNKRALEESVRAREAAAGASAGAAGPGSGNAAGGPDAAAEAEAEAGAGREIKRARSGGGRGAGAGDPEADGDVVMASGDSAA